MSFPATRELLLDAGYKRLFYTRCRGCKEPMEMWLSPNQTHIPMNAMASFDSPAVSHFATCPNAEQFRKREKSDEPV